MKHRIGVVKVGWLTNPQPQCHSAGNDDKCRHTANRVYPSQVVRVFPIYHRFDGHIFYQQCPGKNQSGQQMQVTDQNVSHALIILEFSLLG